MPSALLKIDLRPVDRPDAFGPRGLGELHGARQGVVVCEGEDIVAVAGSGGHELVRLRSAVQEREGGVTVELGVCHEHMFACRAAEGRRPGPSEPRIVRSGEPYDTCHGHRLAP